MFANETEAGGACAEILTEQAKDNPLFRFNVPVDVEFRGDERGCIPWNAVIYAAVLR